MICTLLLSGMILSSFIPLSKAQNIELPDLLSFNDDYPVEGGKKLDLDKSIGTIYNHIPSLTFDKKNNNTYDNNNNNKKNNNLNEENMLSVKPSNKDKQISPESTSSPAAVDIASPSPASPSPSPSPSPSSFGSSFITSILEELENSDLPISFSSAWPSPSLPSSGVDKGEEIPNQYIVVLKDDDTNLKEIFEQVASRTDIQGTELLHIYESVLNGFAIRVPNEKIIQAFERSPFVDHVEPDVIVQISAQTLPTGIDRVDGDLSSASSGNGAGSINADIAIIDTGIDLDHPDLNVYHQKNFVNSGNTWWWYSYLYGSGSSPAEDDNGHGTHVAGITAARDNSIGSVGMAPGAKLWAIKVLDSKGSGSLSTVIKGIDYIAQYSSQIEVANLSLGCQCSSSAFDTAINNAVNKGITFAVSAGNSGKDASTFSPANNPNVIAVSAIGDSDGKCGGIGPSTGYGNDDTLASFSNFGSVVDIAAPGTKIYSTYKGNSYATMSGTSMSASHVSGAAALYLSTNPGASPTDVKNFLSNKGSKPSTICDGNGHGYFSEDKDNYKEPLLYVKGY